MTKVTMKIPANKMLELHRLYGAWMYEEAAESNWDADAANWTRKAFNDLALDLGLSHKDAVDAAYTAATNWNVLKDMGTQIVEIK